MSAYLDHVEQFAAEASRQREQGRRRKGHWKFLLYCLVYLIFIGLWVIGALSGTSILCLIFVPMLMSILPGNRP